MGDGYFFALMSIFRASFGGSKQTRRPRRKVVQAPYGRRAASEQVGTKEAMMTAQELEDYEEVVRRFLDVLPPEKRLAGLAPRALTPLSSTRSVRCD